MKIILMIISLTISCNILKEKKTSFWETEKDKFKYQNLKEFVSDSNLKVDIQSCYKKRHQPIDSLFESKKVYLYSWQDRDSSKNEFTVVKDDGELGLDIFYLILDKKDKLISIIDLAGKGMEGGYIFETKSKFINKDSIFQIQSITHSLDLEKGEKMNKQIGDSTFLYLIINNKGIVTEKKLKEVKALNYYQN